jgi:II/X family phage/plasmid replication protein
MIDSLVIQIPFSFAVVRGRGNSDCPPVLISDPWLIEGVFSVDPCLLPFKKGAKEVTTNKDGLMIAEEIFCPWDSLASSHSGLAVKPFLIGNGKLCWPYLEIKASPAKLAQGHNVYGTDLVSPCMVNMLSVLFQHYPDIEPFLNVLDARVSAIDITYSVSIPFERHRQALIDALRHTSKGQTKNRGDSYESTVYFGSKNSRLRKIKVYLKGPEILRDLEERKRKKLSIPDAATVLVAQDLVRFELTLKKDWFERRLIPVKLFEFCKHFDADPLMIRKVYDAGCKDLFDSLMGKVVKVTNDNDVLNSLEAVHGGTRGRVARLMGFYQGLKGVGFEQLKNQFPERTFRRYVTDLEMSGFSRVHLCSLHETKGTTVIAFPQLVTASMLCDFAPSDYVYPNLNAA